MIKKFRIDELFLVEGTKSLDAGKLEFVNDGINFIGRTNENNGIQGKIKIQSFEPNAKNTITATVIGNYKYVKFQEEPYYCSQNINKLTPLFNIDKLLALYFCTLISKFTSIWNGQQGGYKLEQLKSYQMSIPIIENPNPNHKYTIDDIDWQYIRNYVTELEYDRITELDAYLKASNLNDYELSEEDKKVLSEKPSYDSFKIGSVFYPLKVGFVGKGKKIGSAIKEPNKEHCIPLTCAKIGDNGIMYWGKRGDFITYTNTLSVIADGAISAGLVYAQPEEAGAYSHSYFIDTKEKNVSKYAKQFLSTVLTKVVYPKYSREDAPRWNKIEKDRIYLPSKSDGTPDFNYMERYIRAIEKVVIADVVKYKDEVIKTTKKVVSE